jgi:hypothetical protein
VHYVHGEQRTLARFKHWMRDPMVTRARAGITERELTVLRWVGEQYAVPMALLAELVEREHQVPAGSAPRVARRMAERLASLGYAGRPHAVGRWWLVPTRAGLRAAGLEYETWKIAEHEWSLNHLILCARLRLHLAAAYPEAEWESDRAIRARRHGSGARVRLADGGLHFADGGAVGVELERYVKKPSRYQGAVLDVDPAWTDGVWWFTPTAQVSLLTGRLRDAGGGDVHQVYPLPEEVAL